MLKCKIVNFWGRNCSLLQKREGCNLTLDDVISQCCWRRCSIESADASDLCNPIIKTNFNMIVHTSHHRTSCGSLILKWGDRARHALA